MELRLNLIAAIFISQTISSDQSQHSLATAGGPAVGWEVLLPFWWCFFHPGFPYALFAALPQLQQQVPHQMTVFGHICCFLLSPSLTLVEHPLNNPYQLGRNLTDDWWRTETLRGRWEGISPKIFTPSLMSYPWSSRETFKKRWAWKIKVHNLTR